MWPQPAMEHADGQFDDVGSDVEWLLHGLDENENKRDIAVGGRLPGSSFGASMRRGWFPRDRRARVGTMLGMLVSIALVGRWAVGMLDARPAASVGKPALEAVELPCSVPGENCTSASARHYARAVVRAAHLILSSSKRSPPRTRERAADLPCSAPGENCTLTRCCTAPGHRCSRGNSTWSSCRPAAPAHAAPREAIELVRLPGSKPGENCTLSRRCVTPGHRCFRKNSVWASCRPSCIPGPDPTDPDENPWSCEPLGQKEPGKAPLPNYTVTAAPWVQKLCAGPGENCTAAGCCKESGKQCFTKDSEWSSCKPDCTPGPDPTDANSDPWECKVLGQKTPGPSSGLRLAAPWVKKNCSAKHENCFRSKCCQDKGHQCFLKQGGWAMCLPQCQPGPMLTDVNDDRWLCRPLGGRTPGIARAPEHLPLADWVKKKCSKAGQNCNRTMCCAEHTMQCYEKKELVWAGCLRGCKAGPQKHDKFGGAWSCKELGSRTPRTWGKPSLYCYSVTRLAGYEALILRKQIETDGGVGIFGCDLSDVFASDGEGKLGDGPNGPVRTHHFQSAPVGISVDNTAANAQLFMHAWEAVKQVGKYRLTDWTIKVDPDAVLVASVLRRHLLSHTGKPVYIKNCNSPTLVQQGPSMFGSVEAISRQGLTRYYQRVAADCIGNFQWGEDRWISSCFDKIGVMGVGDYRMVGDRRCLNVGVPESCSDGRAAYHPYKSVESWVGCYYQTQS